MFGSQRKRRRGEGGEGDVEPRRVVQDDKGFGQVGTETLPAAGGEYLYGAFK